MTDTIIDIPVDRLTIGEDVRLDEDPQALAELAASITDLGILQPLLVRPDEDGWEVIAGRRRLSAARIVDLTEVPCIVRLLDDDRAFDVALAENMHRRQLSWIEVALAYDRMRQRGLQQRQIAALVGRHESHVSQILKLLTIPKELQDRVHHREISYSTALDLAKRGATHREGGGCGRQEHPHRSGCRDRHPLAAPSRPADLRDRAGHPGPRRRRTDVAADA